MKKVIEVSLSPEEIVEQLFNFDEMQVAEVFKKWNNKFETNWLEKRKSGEKGMFIF